MIALSAASQNDYFRTDYFKTASLYHIEVRKGFFFPSALNDPTCAMRAGTAPGETTKMPLVCSIRPAVTLEGDGAATHIQGMVDPCKLLLTDTTYNFH